MGCSLNLDPLHPPTLKGIGKPSTLPETNSSHLKIDFWKRRYLLEIIIFQVQAVSFREGILTLRYLVSCIWFPLLHLVGDSEERFPSLMGPLGSGSVEDGTIG